jgi:hypothetical protein
MILLVLDNFLAVKTTIKEKLRFPMVLIVY